MVATTIGERIDQEYTELSERKRDTAERMRAEGVPQAEIMRQLGINPRTYFAWFPEERPLDTDAETRKRLMRRRREMGWTNGEIGREFGMSRQRVNVILGTIEDADGPRSAVPAAYSWRTNPHRLERAESVAKMVGAVNASGEPDLGVLLSMIASGRVVLHLTQEELADREHA